MPHQGLSQFLNSVGLCLVLLTGLGIGAWFNQDRPKSKPQARAQAHVGEEEFEEDELGEAPTVRRVPSKKRGTRNLRVRQAAYQEGETSAVDGIEVPDPDATAETAADRNRVAALPNHLQFAGAILGDVKGIKFELADGEAPATEPFRAIRNSNGTTDVTVKFKITVPDLFVGDGGVKQVGLKISKPKRGKGTDELLINAAETSNVNLDRNSANPEVTLKAAGIYSIELVLYGAGGAVLFPRDGEKSEVWQVTVKDTGSSTTQIRYILQPIPLGAATTDLLVNRPEDQPYLLSSTLQSFDLNLEAAVPGRTYGLFGKQASGNTLLKKLVAPSQSGLALLTADLSILTQRQGTHGISVVDDWTGSPLLSSFNLNVPQDDPTQYPTPVIQTYSNGNFAAFSPPETSGIGTASLISNYIRLKGYNYKAGKSLTFLFYVKKTNPIPGPNTSFPSATNYYLYYRDTKAEVADLGGSNWEAKVTLPVSLEKGNEAWLFCVSGDENNFAVAKPIKITYLTSGSLDTAPTIAKVDLDPATAANPQTKIIGDTELGYGTSSKTLIITGKETGVPANSQVLILDSETQKVLGSFSNSTETETAASWAVKVELPAPKAYKLVAKFVNNGSSASPASKPVDVYYTVTGPSVASFGPKGFGTIPGNVISVAFKTEVGILKSVAETPGNYALSVTRLLDGIAESRDLTKDRFEFDDVKNELKIILAAPMTAGEYQLTIKKSLLDKIGNPMTSDGSPNGGTATVTFGREATAIAATAESTAPKPGEQVLYPEYTVPRPRLDEFLPSDHVETRVARLYYFRDAHRVAQIINRHAESLNARSASMKRQLADKSRQQADQGTDDRKVAERKAEQAANAARTAENQLASEQQRLAQAEQAIDQLTLALEADAARREDLKSQLDALSAQPAASDPVDRQAQLNQIQNLKVQIKSIDLASAPVNRQLSGATSDAQDARKQIGMLESSVQVARNSELTATNDAELNQAKEDRLREDQFRREVAASTEDPDTYAAGDPKSIDPVAQVTITVIGEGVLQLRGPLTGVNKIRTMINEIDQPVGQVRISVHTAQVNGEHGDRMEKVVGRIDNYIEHARFLTTQATEMLRQSILQVASERAFQAAAECPPGDQAARDEKYLYAFFGEDFINELIDMDSEFLKTGNKLLALNSMDTTSLASALFVMALAKNDTRMEILAVFQSKMEQELPESELTYHTAGYAPHFFGDGKYKARKALQSGKNPDKRLLALNAKFSNFRGFFNANVTGPDTLNPSQREFLKLAQIFKSRMITEVELRQRVVERGLIEQKDPDRALLEEERRAASALAAKVRDAALNTRLQTQSDVSVQLARAIARVKSSASLNEALVKSDQLDRVVKAFEDAAPRKKSETEEGQAKSGEIKDLAGRKNKELAEQRYLQSQRSQVIQNLRQAFPDADNGNAWFDEQAETANLEVLLDKVYPVVIKVSKPKINDSTIEFDKKRGVKYGVNEQEFIAAWNSHFASVLRSYEETLRYFTWFNWAAESDRHVIESETFWINHLLKIVRQGGQDKNRTLTSVKILVYGQRNLEPLLIKRQNDRVKWERQAQVLIKSLMAKDYNHQKVLDLWLTAKTELSQAFATKIKNELNFDQLAMQLEEQFGTLDDAVRRETFATLAAQQNSFPLDHRRFLDFLIAETEDKYIELLEGTRSHTANIDNYIKRLITALDDDFNTQFYKPAFQGVRQASRLWDVNLSQIETTSILTNNRGFGKVSPQATMEFDLPKRDILINEALRGTIASYQQFGPLLGDPNFLAYAKLQSGQPTSTLSQRGAGSSSVRNVLPGLPSATDERILGQPGPGAREFNSPLEALIPDPAIYKFESGTGFEVRPVIQPDGQAVVFKFDYLYRTNVREPIRADEKHLGRVKEHFINTDVQLSNFELRKVSDYTVALKTSRTSRGVPLFEDIPGVGLLFRPLPSAESSLQQNVVMAQATIFPTLFDLMGLRWAPAVAELDQFDMRNEEFTVRGRRKVISNKVYDFSSEKVDDFMLIEPQARRRDLYRDQKPVGIQPPIAYEPQETGLSYPVDPNSPTALPQPLPVPGQVPNYPSLPPSGMNQKRPIRQAMRPRETRVDMLPPPANQVAQPLNVQPGNSQPGNAAPESNPATGAFPTNTLPLLTPPADQTQLPNLPPPAANLNEPGSEPAQVPAESSSFLKRRSRISDLIQPAAGVRTTSPRGSSIISADHQSEAGTRGNSIERRQSAPDAGPKPGKKSTANPSPVPQGKQLRAPALIQPVSNSTGSPASGATRSSRPPSFVERASGIQATDSRGSDIVRTGYQSSDSVMVKRTAAAKPPLGKSKQQNLEIDSPVVGKARVSVDHTLPPPSRSSILPWMKRNPKP